MTRSRRTLSLLLLPFLLAPSSAYAGSVSRSAVPFTMIDPSAASTGRGLASTAVFWDQSPNFWANPALLGYHRGLGFDRNETQLVPDLADDVFYRTNLVSIGAYGVGIATSGRPVGGLGNQRLSYGESTATDAAGNSLGTFESQEEIRVFAIGASAGELLQAIAPEVRLAGLPLVRYADVAVGWASKRITSDLSPAIDDLEALRGEVTTLDRGVFARITPIDTEHPWFGSGGHPIGARVDIAYGRSTLNYNNTRIEYVGTDAPNAIARFNRRGWSTSIAISGPVDLEQRMERDLGIGWVASFLDPLVRLGFAWDRPSETVPIPTGFDFPNEGQDVESTEWKQNGWEITILNVLTLRKGRFEDPDGNIFGDTSGWGLGFRSKFGGFRYDEGTRPQAISLDEVKPTGFSVFLDPIAIYEYRQRR